MRLVRRILALLAIVLVGAVLGPEAEAKGPSDATIEVRGWSRQSRFDLPAAT
jgi:hypothetical protein